MAYLLSGERPAAASLTPSRFRALFAWIETYRTARAQRVALHDLLGYDDRRLDDLGLSRQDLHEALTGGSRFPGRVLAGRRANRARSWLRSAH